MAPRPSGHPLWVMPRRGGCFDNAVVADDLTGATTVGALLARIGVQPTVILDHHQLAEVANPDDEVIIVSTDSRPMPPEVAFGRVHTASGVLRDLGAQHFSKRIDTTCRGCIGAETEGMMTAVGDEAVAVIVPAMPQSNRVVAGGYSLINSVLLSRTDVARDIRTPVTESHLPTLFRSQFSVPVAHVDLTDVVGGADQVAARLRSCGPPATRRSSWTPSAWTTSTPSLRPSSGSHGRSSPLIRGRSPSRSPWRPG